MLTKTSLASFVSRYKPHKVLYDSTHDNKKVAIMAGGGAGHEPGQAGLVGKGMLAAAISGDVFASPSAAQICSGIDLANTDAGVIFIVSRAHSTWRIHPSLL